MAMGKDKSKRVNITLAIEQYLAAVQLAKRLNMRSVSQLCAACVAVVAGAVERTERNPTANPSEEDEIAAEMQGYADYEPHPQNVTRYKRTR